MASIEGFRGACFINTDIRKTADTGGGGSRWAWRAKAALLAANVPLVRAVLGDPGSARGSLVLACTAVFSLGFEQKIWQQSKFGPNNFLCR